MNRVFQGAERKTTRFVVQYVMHEFRNNYGAMLIADMRCVLPGSAWTDADATVFKPVAAVSPETWRIIEYETSAFRGSLIQTSNPASAELTIPLDLEGWYAVLIGISGHCQRQPINMVEVKLTGMQHWQLLYASGKFREVPWKIADLTGKHIHIRYPRNPERLHAYGIPDQVYTGVFSVRAVPLKAEHVEQIGRADGRDFVYFHDGHGNFYTAKEPGAHIVTDYLEQFKDGDCGVCCMGHGGGEFVDYPSRIGTRFSQDGWDFPRKGDGNIRDMLRRTLESGVDPLKVAVDRVHENGQKFWLYLRPQTWALMPPFDHAFRSRFFMEHPEFRCVEADGKPISKLSFAFREVRERLSVIIREALVRGADGVCIVFVRGYPLVRYEAPVLDRYREAFGRDARQVPDTDDSLRSIWREFVGNWIGEIRAILDDDAPERTGERRELAVMSGPALEWDAQWGIDVPAWAESGIIDAVLPYPYGSEQPGGKKYETGYVDVAEYADALRDTGVRLLPSLGSWVDHGMPIAEIRKRANRFYEEGADGLCRWDTGGFMAHMDLNNHVIQRLWSEEYLPENDLELVEFAGLDMRRFYPMIGV